VTGTVVETLDASNYTYVRVKTESGEIWAASNTFKVAVGDRVVVPLDMPMPNFHSQSLNRDFPLVYLPTSIAREGDAAAPPMIAAHGSAGGQGASAPAAPAPPELIPLPAGTSSIADVWARRKTLAGKKVTVHGKVVKFNGGILGRNWLHLQDGTGKPAEGTNDLAVTTSAVLKVGDIVTMTGTVGIDKDFGAGYVYPVILESAVPAAGR
jgi:hypothetical protein